MKTTIYITIDNCSSITNHLYYLNLLKEKYNNFKCTIFSPLLENDVSFVNTMNNTGFLEVACYGFHGSGMELEWYNEQQFLSKLNKVEEKFTDKFVKGFKAPQFGYTQSSYEVLTGKNYWIIDSQYNKQQKPDNIKYFKYVKSDNSFYFDGHAVNNTKDNRGIDQSFKSLINSLDSFEEKEFKYISEVVA